MLAMSVFSCPTRIRIVSSGIPAKKEKKRVIIGEIRIVRSGFTGAWYFEQIMGEGLRGWTQAIKKYET